MAIVNVKTIPSIAFMVITGYTITNASFKAVDLETLPDRDILSLNYAINNQQLIGQSGSDKTAINNAAAAISGGEGGGGGDYELPIASEDTLGGIKIGDNLSIDEDGTLNAEAGSSGGAQSNFQIKDWNPWLSGNPIDPEPYFSGDPNRYSVEGNTITISDNTQSGYKVFFLNSNAYVREDQKIAIPYIFDGIEEFGGNVSYQMQMPFLRFDSNMTGLREDGDYNGLVDPDYVHGTPIIVLIDGEDLSMKVQTNNGVFDLVNKFSQQWGYGSTLAILGITGNSGDYSLSITVSLDLADTGGLSIPDGYDEPRAFDDDYGLPTNAAAGKVYRVAGMNATGEYYDGKWFNEGEILIFTTEYDFVSIPVEYKAGGDNPDAVYGYDYHGQLTQIPIKGYRGDLRPSATESGLPDNYTSGDMWRVIEDGYIYLEQVNYVNKNDIIIVWEDNLINLTSKPRDAVTCVYPLNDDDGALVSTFGRAPLYTNYNNRQAFRYVQTGSVPVGGINLALNSNALTNAFTPSMSARGATYKILGCSSGSNIKGNGIIILCFDDENNLTMSISAGFQIDSGSVTANCAVNSAGQAYENLPYDIKPEDCSIGVYFDSNNYAFGWVLNGVNKGIINNSDFSGSKYIFGLYVTDGTSATADAYISGEFISDASRMGYGFPDYVCDLCDNPLPPEPSAVIYWDMSEQLVPAKPKKDEGTVGTVVGDQYDHVGTAYPNNNSSVTYSHFGMVATKELFFIKSNGLNSVPQCYMSIAGCEARFDNNSIVIVGYGENESIVVDSSFTDGAVARFAFDMDENVLHIATTNGADVTVDVETYNTGNPYAEMRMYTSNYAWGGEIHLRFSSANDYGSGLGMDGYFPVSEMAVVLPSTSKDGSLLSVSGGTYNETNYGDDDGALVVSKENGIVIPFGATKSFVESKAQEIVDSAISGLPVPLEDAPNNGNKYVRQNGEWATIYDPMFYQEMVINVDETTTEIFLGNNGDVTTVTIDGAGPHDGFAIEPYQIPTAVDFLIYPKIDVASITWNSGYTVAGGTLSSLTAGEFRVVRRVDNLGLILIIK